MGVLQTLATLGIAHVVIWIIFGFLILCMVARMLLSFFPMLSPANPFVRFINNIMAPIYDPVYRRLPRMSVGVLDLSATIAFIFTVWALIVVWRLAMTAIPAEW